MPVNVAMIDKNGNEWIAGSAQEVNDLRAQGYRFKGAGQQTPAPTTTPAPADPAPPAPADPAPAAEKPGGSA